MEIKNIDNKYVIVKKNNNGKKTRIVSGVLATALFLTLTGCSLTNRNKIDDGQEKYGYYSISYLESLEHMDYDKFDQNFVDIFNSGEYTINGNKYAVNEIYIAELEDGSKHIYKAGINNVDVVSGLEFSGKKVKICCFRQATTFYKMYTDGLITGKEINIDNNTLQEYINSWDGATHYETPELAADKEATDLYVKKYGR